MGTCQSNSSDTETKTTGAICDLPVGFNQRIEKKESMTTVKILLLGPGESGKSTVLKQMRIIHSNGYTESELLSMKEAIFHNCLRSMQNILTAMAELGYEAKFELAVCGKKERWQRTTSEINDICKTGENEGKWFTPNKRQDRGMKEDITYLKELKSADYIGGMFGRVRSEFPSLIEDFQTLSVKLKRLWETKMIKKVFERRAEFQLIDSAGYFFDNLDRLAEPDYMPTVQDVLMTRVATSGVAEITYTYKNIYFRIFDVGGQKSERRKWIHCFDDVNAILFIAAISEYDQFMREERRKNRMIDAMSLFSDIVNMQFFAQTEVILFLNKKDLFAEKIDTVPLTICFKKYKGLSNYEAATTYIMKCFDRLKKDTEKALYMHLTCATDTNQVQLVIQNSIDMIIAQNFKQAGVL